MPEVDVLKISNEDAAFVLGKNGKTKEKIARVSGADLDLYEHSLTLEIRGTDDERKRAKKYVECVMAQRVGPVTIEDNNNEDDDLTVIQVPSEAVGFVTGSQGNFLRQVEEEWGTLMFFADFRGRGERVEGDTEKLAIFGRTRGRRGAELKVMAAVETKVPGYFTERMVVPEDDKDGFGTRTLVLKPEELSYALGKKGMTRKKLARSSQCIVEYVGYTVFMSGMPDERARAKEYLDWLFDQLRGPVYVDNWEQRDDVTMVDVPRDCVGYVTGARRATLGKIEEEWGTLMFFMSTNMRRDDRGQGSDRREFDGSEKLAIFGDRRGRRGAELKCMSAVETKRPGYFTREVKKHTSDKEGFASDTYPMDESELSYALGKDGTTRRKLARASGCIMEYVGQVAFICGTIEERTRARTYLKWLLKQRAGSVYVDDLQERDDVTIVPIPRDAIGYVTGNRGSSLRQVEEDSGTFCFVEGGRGESEQLLIFGHKKADREVAERLINSLIQEKMRDGDRGGGDRYDDRRRDDRYDDRRRDDRYDDRRYDDRDRGRGGYDDRGRGGGGGGRGYDDRDRGRGRDRSYDRDDDYYDRGRDRGGGRDRRDDYDDRRDRGRDRRDDYDDRRGRDRRRDDDDYDDDRR